MNVKELRKNEHAIQTLETKPEIPVSMSTIPGCGRSGSGEALRKKRSEFFFTILFFLIFFSCIPVAGASEVTLFTPQSEYYFITGQDAVMPLGIVSTYDHDITGTLNLAVIPANTGSDPGSTSVNSRSFSAFTEERIVSLPVGKSDIPADYHLALTFSYPENGGRISTLNGIVIHYVTNPQDKPDRHQTLTGTDVLNPAAGSPPAGTAPEVTLQAGSQDAKFQGSQMAQDTTALRDQLAKESNLSRNEEDELLGYLLTDPLLISLDRELKGAGFAQSTPEVRPVSNRSGGFLLTYSSGTGNMTVRGEILDARVQYAEEHADIPIPLPGALRDNTTYQDYTRRIAGNGFITQGTRINVTPALTTTGITYTGTGNRNLRLTAEIKNGTVTRVEGENPDDPLATFFPALAFIGAALISACIWYLARHRQEGGEDSQNGIPQADSPEPPIDFARHLLDLAEQDAARGSWPEAYRKTGRALRVFLSHKKGCGDELTCRELLALVGSSAGDREQIQFVLSRCMAVGFAKDMPRDGEFSELIHSVRHFLDPYPAS